MAGDFLSALLNYNVSPIQGHNGIFAPPDPGMGEANNTTAPQDPVNALIALRASLSGGAPNLNIQRTTTTTTVPGASAIGAPNSAIGSGVYDPFAGTGAAAVANTTLGNGLFSDPSLYQPPALAPLGSQLGGPPDKTRFGRAN